MKKVVRIISNLLIIIPISDLFIGSCSAEKREESIMSRPIIERKSISAINIGDHESDIYKTIGFPDKLESNFSTASGLEGEGLKLLIYGIGEGGLFLLYIPDINGSMPFGCLVILEDPLTKVRQQRELA